MAEQKPRMKNIDFITIKIDVTKIVKAHMFTGKPNEKTGKSPVYLDAILFPNKDGKSQYGQTHYIVQSISKEARQAGEKGPIIGNATVPAADDVRPGTKAADAGPEDDVPF